MARIVIPPPGTARPSRWVRAYRLLLYRAIRCSGAHASCPGCKRVPLPFACIARVAPRRSTRRMRFGALDPAEELPALRRRIRTPRRTS
ncbi:MAG: hypothetical protein U1F54_10475 [Burkholderiales bacterium]